MELTRQNLLRVGDIVAEIERNLGSLKRQAAKAERYVALPQRARGPASARRLAPLLELVGWTKLHGDEVEQRTVQADERSHRSSTAREAELEAARLEALAAEERRRAGADAARSGRRTRCAPRKLPSRAARTGSRRSGRASRRPRASPRDRGAATAELERERVALRGRGGASSRTTKSSGAAQADAEEARSPRRRASSRPPRRWPPSTRGRVGRAGGDRERGGDPRRPRAPRGGDEVAPREGCTRARGPRRSSRRARGQARGLETRRRRAAPTARSSAPRSEARAEDRLAELRTSIVESERAVEAAQDRARREAQLALRALEEMHARLEGVGAGARARSSSKDDGAVLGLVADRIEAPAELTAALGGSARRAAAVRRRLAISSAASTLLDELRRRPRAGRATIVPARPRVRGRRLEPAFPSTTA